MSKNIFIVSIVFLLSLFSIQSNVYAQTSIGQGSSITYESDAQVLNVPCGVANNICLGSIQLGLPVYMVGAGYCSSSFDSSGNCIGGTTPQIAFSQSPASLESWYLNNMIPIYNARGKAGQVAPASFSIADTKCSTTWVCMIYYNHTNSNGDAFYDAYGNFGINIYTSVVSCPSNGIYVNGKGCIVPNLSDRTVPNCDCDKPTLGFADWFKSLVGDPIDSLSGQTVEEKEDISFPMSLNRYYLSGNSQYGILGGGWRTQYDHYLNKFSSNPNMPSTIDIVEPNGVELLFSVSANGAFTPLFQEQNLYSLTINNQNNYVLTFPNGKQEIYNYQGQIISEINMNGSFINYTYSAGLLFRVTDNFGHWLQFTYSNVANAVIQVSA